MPKSKENPRETVYLNSVTKNQLALLHEQYPRRTKSDIINAGVEHLFLSGYEHGLDGNLLPINPVAYAAKEHAKATPTFKAARTEETPAPKPKAYARTKGKKT